MTRGVGFLDDVGVRDVAKFEKEFLTFMRDTKGALRADIQAKKELSDALKQSLRDALTEFKRSWKPAAK